MRTTPHRLTGLLCILLVSLPAILGEVIVGESLEWLIESSSGIAVYRVSALKTVEKRPTRDRVKVEAAVETRLSGTAPERVTFEVVERPGAGPARRTEKNDEFLVFFRAGDAERLDESPLYPINLSSPPVSGFLRIAITGSFEVLDTKEKILNFVRARLTIKERGERPKRVMVDVPVSSPAFRALWHGSSCSLVVPADRGLRKRLLDQINSNDVHRRAGAARLLSAYDDPESIRALKSLLNDAETVLLENEKLGGLLLSRTRHYPARSAAQESLRELGVSFTGPEATVPLPPSGPILVLAVALLAPAILCAAILFRRRRSGDEPSRPGSA